MGNKKGIRMMALFLAALMILGMLGPIMLRAFAAETASSLQKKLDDLGKQQKALQKKIDSSNATKKTEIQKKNDLERQINNLDEKIVVYEQLIEDYDVKIREKEIQSKVIQQELDERFDLYLLYIRETYELGNASFLDVLFGSATLNEFLTNLDHAAEISQYNEDMMAEMRANRDAVLSAKAEIEEARAEQNRLLKSLEKDKNALKTQQNQVDNLIDELNSDISKQKKMLKEIAAEEERFSKELKKLLANRPESNYAGGSMRWPTPGYTTITCPFGMRTHPITGVYKMHTGIDIGAAGGSKILAANAGTVVSKGYNSAWGNYVAIDHGGGLSTFYAHMKSSALVSVGAKVAKGEKIGVVGSTGYSTGNHLHFEVRVKGESVQPLNYVQPS
ncbi:MAG: peptidoglycan DD-metalloendopeptidase family protein [Clostridia bacterium]|nr:peptidoglycan DD-metalloendopeptidase family protein [Clostridia bacterium]